MAQHNSQIFQTNNPTRWQRFKWAGRIFLVLALVAFAAIVVALINASLPDIPLEGRAIKKVLSEKVPDYRESKMGREYRGMRKYIQEKWPKGKVWGKVTQTSTCQILHYLMIA